MAGTWDEEIIGGDLHSIESDRALIKRSNLVNGHAQKEQKGSKTTITTFYFGCDFSSMSRPKVRTVHCSYQLRASQAAGVSSAIRLIGKFAKPGKIEQR